MLNFGKFEAEKRQFRGKKENFKPRLIKQLLNMFWLCCESSMIS